jgi:glycosyltransferase involved in cell wall biosynthesis
MSRPGIIILTYSPSPYQVELLNELSSRSNLGITAIYLWESDPSRMWKTKERDHEFLSLNRDPLKLAEATALVRATDLCVFNFYTDEFSARLLQTRVHSGKPWIFWGERPGFHLHPALGKFLRRWKLRALHKSSAPIWGIGRWAVEQYRKEFGVNRRYADIPYFSDLRRFQYARQPRSDKTVFLFSGAINKRKGVDLLAKAFLDLVRSHSNVELLVLGEGEYIPKLKMALCVCSDRVRFLGFRDWEELPSVYREADFLCAPSHYDGWALVVPEALASGLPVIGTDRTGAAIEFIKTGKNGWLIPAGNSAALLNAMRVAADLSENEKMQWALNAQRTVADHQLEDGVRMILSEVENALANWS